MTTEPLRGFPKMLQAALLEGKTGYVTKLFGDERYSNEVKQNSWDIIPIITQYLTEKNKLENNELFKCCVNLLTIISESCNPEETLLQFISEIEEAKENSKFIVLLEPLYTVITKISTKKINSLAWSFNAIQTYLMHCEFPNYDNLDGKERLVVDNNEIVANIIRLYTEVELFYDKFINNINKNTNMEIKRVLCKFLVQLLGSPLSYLSMEVFDSIKTDGRLIAEDVVKQILKTIQDPFILTEMRFEKESDELFKPEDKSVATLFYLMYYEGVCLELIPKVYSPRYIFETSLVLVSCLLEENNIILKDKALKLAQSVFGQVKGQNLPFWILDCEDHVIFCTGLTNIIIYDQSDFLRKTALLVFELYLKSFELKGVYLVILNLMGLVRHSGLKAYMITYYKNLLCKQFNDGEEIMVKCFMGAELFSILRKFCYLPEKEESNLMEISDEIISSLNLLRYLVLRDKHNTTKIWDFLTTLEDIYLRPLRKGIELSRAHYELEIKNLSEKKFSRKDKDKEEKVTVTVSGMKLPDVNIQEKLNILNSSLTGFDVIDSLLSRVVELIENKLY